MFKVNIKDTRRRSGVFLVNFQHVLHVILISILLTLNKKMFARSPCFNTIYTIAEQHNRFTVFIVDFEHFSHLVLVFLLLTTPEQNDIITLLSSLLILNIYHTWF